MTDNRTNYDARLAASFERSLDLIANDLRAMADSVEHKKKVCKVLQRPYLSAANEVMSDIMNMLPSLRLPLLVERAIDCELLMEGE